MLSLINGRSVINNIKQHYILFIIAVFTILTNGCVAMAPVASIIGAGMMGGVMTVQVINNAKDQYPNVNFDKKSPECIDYKDYNNLYQNALKSVYDLKEQTYGTDKESGVITTQKAPFGEKPDAVSYFMGKKVFWQRKIIYIKKLSESKAQICVKVKFSRKGGMTEEEEFDDPDGENVVRAIFYDKLDQLLGTSSVPSPEIAEKKADSQEESKEPDTKQDIKERDQLARGQEQSGPKTAESCIPTIAEVRKAKKHQGLSGYIFQDQESKKCYLEDNDGITYKFDGGHWKKLN